MILLLVWAFVGVVLGYESAKHGIVQIIVPTLFLFAFAVWALAGIVIAYRVSNKKPRGAPNADQVRKAWENLSKSREKSGEAPRHDL